jgi:hypothetical protein
MTADRRATRSCQRGAGKGLRVLAASCVLGSVIFSQTAAAYYRQPQYGGYLGFMDDPHAKGTVQAQFVVPTVTCPNALPGVAEFEVRVSTSKPIGDPNPPPDVTAAINATCTAQNATPSYAAVSTLGTMQMTISPGDRVVLRAAVDPTLTKRNKRATVHDETTGVTKSVVGNTESPNEQPYRAFIGMFQVNGAGAAYPNFGRFEWVHATMTDQPVSDALFEQPYVLTGSNNADVLVRASALSPSGRSFWNTWLNGT